MKTENTCMNCVMLNCSVRLECEDNELETEIQKVQDKTENGVTVQVIDPKLTAKNNIC